MEWINTETGAVNMETVSRDAVGETLGELCFVLNLAEATE
jgi:hypothetical protein